MCICGYRWPDGIENFNIFANRSTDAFLLKFVDEKGYSALIKYVEGALYGI